MRLYGERLCLSKVLVKRTVTLITAFFILISFKSVNIL